METNKVLSAVCYLGVLFMPLIVPIVIFFVVDDDFVKKQAKSSIWSQLIPVLFFPLLIVEMIFYIPEQGDFPGLFLLTFFAFICVSLIVLIWNIVKGIKLLIK